MMVFIGANVELSFISHKTRYDGSWVKSMRVVVPLFNVLLRWNGF